MTDQETTPESSTADPMRTRSAASTASSCGKAMRFGEPCPYCGLITITYDGMLNLVCKNCGAVQGGAFT